MVFLSFRGEPLSEFEKFYAGIRIQIAGNKYGRMAPTYFDGPRGRGDQRPVFTAYRSLREWLSEGVFRPLGAHCGHSIMLSFSPEPRFGYYRLRLFSVLWSALSWMAALLCESGLYHLGSVIALIGY